MNLGKWLTNSSKAEANDMMLERNKARPLTKTLLTGDPKATDTYTVDELKKMGMVGVYELDISRWGMK